jgi:hypothetical protein
LDVDGISLGKVPPPPTSKGLLSVGLSGYDTDEVGNQYCCSFPFEKAIDPFGDVILAFEMNGQPIPRQHGYPVRAIVPGMNLSVCGGGGCWTVMSTVLYVSG